MTAAFSSNSSRLTYDSTFRYFSVDRRGWISIYTLFIRTILDKFACKNHFQKHVTFIKAASWNCVLPSHVVQEDSRVKINFYEGGGGGRMEKSYSKEWEERMEGKDPVRSEYR